MEKLSIQSTKFSCSNLAHAFVTKESLQIDHAISLSNIMNVNKLKRKKQVKFTKRWMKSSTHVGKIFDTSHVYITKYAETWWVLVILSVELKWVNSVFLWWWWRLALIALCKQSKRVNLPHKVCHTCPSTKTKPYYQNPYHNEGVDHKHCRPSW